MEPLADVQRETYWVSLSIGDESGLNRLAFFVFPVFTQRAAGEDVFNADL